MDDLIDALLTLSRLGRCELRAARVDLSRLARDVLSEVQLGEPGRIVESIVAPSVVAHGDPRMLRIVIENLLHNAWKYTSRRARARIEFGVAEVEGRPTYFVRDDGAGFDMAYADRLFSPFVRLHDPAEFEGTGIGLATVQRIVHRHGGRVWAEAKPEQGATVYFTLAAPLRRVAPRPVRRAEGRGAGSASSG